MTLFYQACAWQAHVMSMGQDVQWILYRRQCSFFAQGISLNQEPIGICVCIFERAVVLKKPHDWNVQWGNDIPHWSSAIFPGHLGRLGDSGLISDIRSVIPIW
jgi:hypothetical protein